MDKKISADSAWFDMVHPWSAKSEVEKNVCRQVNSVCEAHLLNGIVIGPMFRTKHDLLKSLLLQTNKKFVKKIHKIILAVTSWGS